MKSTKQLAWELGLLRKRSSSSSNIQKIKKTCQLFSYLIVIDFESTCWQDGKHRSQEIIEFPAVLLNTSTGEIETEFQYYVQPQENPVLSEFCNQLTGITQEQVEQGIPLSICIRKFTQWLKQMSEERNFVYNTAEDPMQKKCTFVTWSDWDLSVCLQYEVQRKQLRKPPALNSWLDLRATYRKFYDRKPNGLNGALQDLGITFQGREHSGLDDARNTAKLAFRMMSDGCIMQITKTLPSSIYVGKPPIFGCSVTSNGSVKPPLRASERSSTTDRTVEQFCNTGNSTSVGVLSVPKVINNTTLSTSIGHTKEVTLQEHSNSGLKNRSYTAIMVKNPCAVSSFDSNVSGSKFSKTNAKVSHSQTVVAASVTTSYNGTLKRTVGQQASGLPVNVKSNGFEIYQDITSHKTTKVMVSSSGSNPSVFKDRTNSKQPCGKSCISFKTPSPVNETISNNTNFRAPSSVNMQSNSNSWRLRTPSPIHNDNNNKSNTRPISESSMKKTPPMCQCGRRATRKIVQSPGPNIERPFYCCPIGRAGYTGKNGVKKFGCGFFKWESVNSASPQLRQMTFYTNQNGGSNTGNSGVWKNQTTTKGSAEQNSLYKLVKSPLQQPNFDTPKNVNRVQSIIQL